MGLGGGRAVGVAVVAQAPGPRGRQRQAGGERHGDEQAGQPACELHHVLYLTPKVKRALTTRPNAAITWSTAASGISG